MIQPVKNADGFTLLELILSMVIVGFIVAISLGAIRMGIATQEVGQIKTETYQRLRIIGEHLSQKIKSSYPVFVPAPDAISLTTKTSKKKVKRLLAFEGKKDSIRFVTFASPIASTDDSVWAHEVRFYLGEHPENGKKGIIMAEKDISNSEIFAETRAAQKNERYYLLAEDVAYLKFRYYTLEQDFPVGLALKRENLSYKGKWVDQILFNPPIPSTTDFTSGDGKTFKKKYIITLPKAVKISFGLLEPVSQGSDKKPKLVSSPPVHLLLHSGMRFTLPVLEEEGINAAS